MFYSIRKLKSVEIMSPQGHGLQLYIDLTDKAKGVTVVGVRALHERFEGTRPGAN